ncbi:hypothetical protein [Paenibacillus sp. NPDC058177]
MQEEELATKYENTSEYSSAKKGFVRDMEQLALARFNESRQKN